MMISAKGHRSTAKGCYSETCRRQTDELGAEFPHRTFGWGYDVTPLRFDSQYTNLDTVFDVLSRDHALLYEPAFEASSLQCIQEAYPSVIFPSDKEQQNSGASMLCLSPDRVIFIAENRSIGERLVRLGLKVVTLSFSKVIKSGGHVRCDTLRVEGSSWKT